MTRKAKKAKPGEPTHLSCVVDGALVQALDEEAKHMTSDRAGLKFTRTDVLRVLLHDWVAAQGKKP